MRLRNIPGSRDIIAESSWVVKTLLPIVPPGIRFFRTTIPAHRSRNGKGAFFNGSGSSLSGTKLHRHRNVQQRSAAGRTEGRRPGRLPSRTSRQFPLPAAGRPGTGFSFCPGRSGADLPEFFRPLAQRPPRQTAPDLQDFLARYEQILAPGGHVEFKTDNQDLFRFSLEEIRAKNWILEASTFDLHRDPVLNQNNIMTEYEEKFSSMGHPICKLIARPK